MYCAKEYRKRSETLEPKTKTRITHLHTPPRVAVAQAVSEPVDDRLQRVPFNPSYHGRPTAAPGSSAFTG